MATHTTNGNYGRKFSISRENGQVNKDGRPYFFEWLQTLPADPGKRKFETRTKDGDVRHYELFTALDGILTGIDRETKKFSDKSETWLVVHISDGDEEYRVELGRIDGRWSIDFMKRILDSNFAPNQKIRISPIASEGKMFLSTYSGPNKLESKWELPHLAGMPQPDTREWKGQTEYDFSPVSEWLYSQVKIRVCPALSHDPISTPRTPMPAPDTRFPTTAATPPIGTNDPFPVSEPVETDDLPF